MFNAARIKLTAWYLATIMVISIVFSFFLYHIACQQIIRLIQVQHQKVKDWQINPQQMSSVNPLPILNQQDQQNAEKTLVDCLVLVNFGILIVAGGAGYLLAGRTLRPIKEMLEEQTQFISNASHQLRTPIATLRAEMEGSLLESHISDQKARELISSNLEEIETLQSLANRLLKLAQLHNGSKEMYMQPISLGEIIAYAQKKVAPLAIKKAINIKITGDTNGQIIAGVKSDLIELFIILLDNAIKYSPKGKNIYMTIKSEEAKIKIMVKDQGIGISSQDLPHIFNRFYRSQTSHSQNDGYGLGLSIAQKIIETHKGTIYVKSEVGMGTSFMLELPIAIVTK